MTEEQIKEFVRYFHIAVDPELLTRKILMEREAKRASTVIVLAKDHSIKSII